MELALLNLKMPPYFASPDQLTFVWFRQYQRLQKHRLCLLLDQGGPSEMEYLESALQQHKQHYTGKAYDLQHEDLKTAYLEMKNKQLLIGIRDIEREQDEILENIL